MQTTDPADIKWMEQAVELAERGRFTTSPNPSVGCVLVKDGQCIGSGWHQRAGLAHAETNAIQDALAKCMQTQGATAYVTLEPCSHHGKTPPCAQALVEAGIKRVVIGMQDCNPLVSGRGIEHLRNHRIEVLTNFFSFDDCQHLQTTYNALCEAFIHRQTHQRPLVIAKLAMSLDGRIALANGASRWVSSSESRADVHLLRASSDVILSSAKTVIQDNAQLNVRLSEVQEKAFNISETTNQQLQPIPVIVDKNLEICENSKVLSIHKKIAIFCSDTLEEQKIQQKQQQLGQHITIYPVETDSVGNLKLAKILQVLYDWPINQILLEMGGNMLGQFIQQRLIDQLIIYFAPKILGADGVSAFQINGIQQLTESYQYQFSKISVIGEFSDDLKICLIPA